MYECYVLHICIHIEAQGQIIIFSFSLSLSLPLSFVHSSINYYCCYVLIAFLAYICHAHYSLWITYSYLFNNNVVLIQIWDKISYSHLISHNSFVWWRVLRVGAQDITVCFMRSYSAVCSATLCCLFFDYFFFCFVTNAKFWVLPDL